MIFQQNIFRSCRNLVTLLGLAVVLLLPVPSRAAAAGTEAETGPILQPALMIDNPQSVAILGIAQAGPRLVAVGEHGVIAYSDDQGMQWSQAVTPVSATLTSVHFVTPREGFATGHFGVVLKTVNAGKDWVLVLDGVTAAKLAYSAAQQMLAATPADSDAADALSEAKRLLKAGPDKPFFDSYFSNARTGFVVGAYNLIYRTTDGGASWTAWMSHMDNAKRSHLYAIAAGSNAIYIAGEQGLLLRSTDAGQTFHAVPLPYGGSFFSVAVGPNNDVIVAGMEGNAFHARGQSSLWQKIPNLPPVSVVGVLFSQDGTLWLANQTGQIFSSHDAGASLAPLPPEAGPPPPPFTSILPLGADILAGTVAGIERIVPATSTSSPGTASDGS